jgi:DNA-binding NarL/FixJ family response regulator
MEAISREAQEISGSTEKPETSPKTAKADIGERTPQRDAVGVYAMNDGALKSESTLVGRQRELAVLWKQFEESLTGRLCVALVAGEPGIGKTRLLQEVAQRAEQAGALVLRGGASESEGMPPYLPFLEALGSYIRTASREQLRTQAGPMASILATILPELPRQLGELAGSSPLPPEQARLRLFEAVGTLLSRLSATAPLMLLLDDLQWADPASLDLLCHLARQCTTSHLLLLGAYRSSELVGHPELSRALLSLTRLRVLTSLSLGPLDVSAVADLAQGVLGTPVDQQTAQVLSTQSEGNPFFTEEVLRAWSEVGALTRMAQCFTLVKPADNLLPSSIVGVVRARLSRLPAVTVETLRTAALVGRTFEVTVLAEVIGELPEAVEESLGPAVQAELLRAEPPDCYTFSHDKVRECLSAEVAQLRHRRLHGLIGHVLEARADHEGNQSLAELAFHWSLSGDRERGASYARRAAEQAWHAYAFADAMRHYRTTLDLLPAQDGQRGTVLMCLGEAALLAGAEREAIPAFEEAQAWFQARQDKTAVALAAHGLGRAWSRLEGHAEALAAFETALAELLDEPGLQRVQVLVDLATLLAVSLGRQQEGLRAGQQALELAQKQEDTHLEAMASRTVGNLLMRANLLEEALPLLERALVLAKALNDPVEASECCACLTLAYIWSNHHRTEAITRERLTWAKLTHDPYQMRHAYTWVGAVAGMQGKFAESEQWFTQAETALFSLASPEPHAYLHYCRGWGAYVRGDYAVAEEQFSQASALFRELGPNVVVWYLAPLSLTYFQQGKRDEALSCLHEVEALLSSQEEGTISMALALCEVSQLVISMRDQERVAHYHRQLLPFQGRFLSFLTDRVLGELEMQLVDWTTAQDHLSRADATARSVGLTPELARTLVAQGRLVLAHGGRASRALGVALFEAALALFEQVGMQAEALAVREHLAHLPKKSRSRSALPLPAGLTAREAEVLRLIATGKSNRQIAEVLVLSERTVANHLAHILNKTGTDNRAAATAFAVRHGLA